MDTKQNPGKITKKTFYGVDVEDFDSAHKAVRNIAEGCKLLVQQHGKNLPPMVAVCAVREALQWVCGELHVPVQSMLDHYRNLLLGCSPPCDPHLQGQPGHRD